MNAVMSGYNAWFEAGLLRYMQTLQDFVDIDIIKMYYTYAHNIDYVFIF